MLGRRLSILCVGINHLLLLCSACTPPPITPCNPYYSAAARSSAFPNFDATTGTLNGDLPITTNKEWTDYFCVEHVIGNLSVSGNSSFQAGLLLRLQSVTGNVSLDYNLHNASPATGTDPRIRKFSLPALQLVGGGLDIKAADTGMDTSKDGASAIGLDALTSVGGTIHLSWLIGPAYSPSGLSGLSTHNSNIEIRLHGDQSHLGMMAHLGTVQGNVTFNPGTGTVADILPTLTAIGGTLRIEEDCSATILAGAKGPGWFHTLQTVGGDLTFYQTTHLGYYGMLSALQTVSGEWQLLGTKLQDFPLSPTNNLVVGGIRIEDNVRLALLSSTNIQVTSNGPLVIDNNCILPATIATQFVTQQMASGWAGTPDVHDNGAGPSTCGMCSTPPVPKPAP